MIPSIISSSASLISAEPITKLPAVTAPVAVREAAPIAPAPEMALEPITRASACVPKLVRLELTTEPPRVVALSTDAPLTLYALPEAASTSMLDFQAVLAWL